VTGKNHWEIRRATPVVGPSSARADDVVVAADRSHADDEFRRGARILASMMGVDREE
jgi:hypothetical protein